jgi:Tat protein translocase TatB subunit
VVLFIFESLGTSELLLIGILALVLLGPRKLPEMARKAGKIMAEFRGTAAEFKETWQREVNFEEESKALRDINLDDEAKALRFDDIDDQPMSNREDKPHDDHVLAPLISDADPAKFEGLIPKEPAFSKQKLEKPQPENDKKTWL